MIALWERALNLFFFLREYMLLFLWILFLETENKISVETKRQMCIRSFHCDITNYFYGHTC